MKMQIMSMRTLMKIGGAFVLLLMVSCQNATKPIKVEVPNQTLIVSGNGELLNFNLDTQSLAWKYASKQDLSGNRNRFVYDEKAIYLPFESGKFVSVDINTGKVNWTNTAVGSDGIMEGYVDEDGESFSEDTGEVNYMTTPLVYGDKVYIASCSGRPQFLTFNKLDGSSFASDNVNTKFNMYKPVVCRGNIFVTSAVYLDMYTEVGTWTSYGMHDEACFESPLYVQPQSDGKTLFLGEEAGKFYALPLSSNADIPGENDIMDVDNTFTKREGLFDWVYQSSEYPRLATYSGSTALVDNTFIVCVEGDNNRQALVGINTGNGKEKWIFEANDEIRNWNITGDEIIGYTSGDIFVLNLKGDLTGKYQIDTVLPPLSDIISTKVLNLIFITTKGVSLLSRPNQKTTLLIPYNFAENEHNRYSIAYFSN